MNQLKFLSLALKPALLGAIATVEGIQKVVAAFDKDPQHDNTVESTLKKLDALLIQAKAIVDTLPF